MYTLGQYLFTLDDPHGLLRTLDGLEPERGADGRPLHAVGNSAAVFRVRCGGRRMALRCFLRPMRHLREIYGERLYERELFLYTAPDQGLWADVVLTDWIEGPTLREAIDRAVADGDAARLGELARRFDALAAELIADDTAHGDLKPENLVVEAEGQLHPIDLDAMFLPAFAGERSPELGTSAYQHPTRTVETFDERIDDYPAALISTALHALAADPGLGARYAGSDGLLFNPARIPREAAYREVVALFELRGMAVQYRIARLLESPVPQLPGLGVLLREAVRMAERPESTPAPAGPQPELFEQEGRWGFRLAGQVVIPPLYDNGFDFTEGLAAVRLGQTWHYIAPAGRTRLSCPGCQAVKPFRNGRAQIVRNGRRAAIDPSGRILEN